MLDAGLWMRCDHGRQDQEYAKVRRVLLFKLTSDQNGVRRRLGGNRDDVSDDGIRDDFIRDDFIRDDVSDGIRDDVSNGIRANVSGGIRANASANVSDGIQH